MAAHSDWPPTRVPFRTWPVSGAAWGAVALLVLLGALAFLLGMMGEGAERAWHAFHFNWLFWSSVATGMVVFTMAMHVTNSRWSWSVRRFAAAGAAFLPVSLLLYFVMWGGSRFYFEHWIGGYEGDPVLEEKAAWLNLTGMMVRDTLAVLVLYGMMLWFTYHMLRPDLGGIRGPGIYRRLTRGWRGAREEALHSRKIGLRIAAVASILFALLWGLVAIDQAMTMLPHWFSTMFPVTFLVSAFHSALAMTALLSVIGRGRARLHDQVTGAQFHDLGKLIFAYSVFWMYVNWSQYVVIWYGLLPHEQEFFVLRFQKPFSLVTEIMVGCVFVIPFFFLLTRPPKKVPPFLAFVSVIVLVGHWLERFLITVPSVWQHDYLPLGLTEIGVALGFAGLFFGSVLWFLKTFPVLPSPASLAAIPAPVFTLPPRSAPAEA
ncbi:MAG TPA: hypothetical protein VF746_19120 [Longimicrobium sp.]|jgi:hypothetical protein